MISQVTSSYTNGRVLCTQFLTHKSRKKFDYSVWSAINMPLIELKRRLLVYVTTRLNELLTHLLHALGKHSLFHVTVLLGILSHIFSDAHRAKFWTTH